MIITESTDKMDLHEQADQILKGDATYQQPRVAKADLIGLPSDMEVIVNGSKGESDRRKGLMVGGTTWRH